jgi:mannose-1-phosphate guanylyltransferase
MKAVIMAGGEGTRLRPITLTRPKPLVPVAGDACIDFVINGLVKAGVDEIIITTGYRFQEILDHTGDGSRYGDVRISFSIEEVRMGTAGGVKQIDTQLDDTFIVASGDVLADVDFERLIAFHRRNEAEATMALTTVEEPTQFGIVGTGGDGRIQRFKEKPAPEEVFSNLINAGIYIIEPHVLDLIPEGTKYDFSKQLFPDMLSRGMRLFATPLSGFWKDIGHPFDLIEANMEMIERKGGSIFQTPASIHPATVRIPPVMLGSGVLVGEGSTIDGSALYPGSRVSRDSTLKDSVVLAHARIGRDCSIRHSVIGSGTIIHDSCTIEDSILGDGLEIPEGTTYRGIRIPEST